MKKTLLYTLSILPRKLISVLSYLCIIHCSLFINHCYGQWYKQQIPVNKTVTGIKFTDTLNGWASTGDFFDTSFQNTGCILHTTNGGANWSIQLGKSRFAFSTMTMVNNMTGYAFGDSLGPLVGRVEFLKTTNGGVNWFNIPIPNTMWISRFYFLSPDTGWETDNAASSPDARLTIDGGYTWLQRINGMTSYPTRSVFFLNYNTGWCGSGNILYKTTNAGSNWQVNGAFSDDISSIFFLNENTGWAGLTPDTTDKIAYTSNGGSNWVIQNIGSPYNFYINDIFFFNNKLGYACTGFEKICKTVNSGFPWGYQNDSSYSDKMSFSDSLHGWTGFIGISHTSNGGGSITYIGIINISNGIPEQYKLFQNYPNPFNPSTKIRFSLIKASYVNIKIYDISGRELNPWIFGWYPETLLDPGTHEFQFDGSEMASGVYFFKLIVTDKAKTSNKIYESTIKMILVK